MKRRSRNNLHTQEMLYRPALEFRSALILILFSVYVLIDSWTSKYGISEIPFYCSLGLIAMACWRIWHGVPVFRAHWRLFHRTMDFLSLEDFRMINNAHFFADDRKYQKLVSFQKSGGAASKKSVYKLLRKKEKIVIPQRTTFLCNGFKWGPEHSERTYQVHNLSSDMHEVQLPFILNPITRHYRKLAFDLGGNYAIFGVDKKVPIFVNEENFFGHTLITGNVGIRIYGEMGTGSPTGDGVIIARALREAWDNPHAKAILIEAESGGGGPPDAINIYREINELRDSLHGAPGLTIENPDPTTSQNKKDMPPAPSETVKQALLKAVGTGHGRLPAAARDVRPIIVSIKNMCASACYYAASPADAIYADPNAIIGSIGVRMDHWDVSRIMDRLGVANEPLTAGAWKASLDPWRPIDDETKAFLHSELLNKMHDQFINDVEAGRKGKLLSREQADKEQLYTGRFWLGNRAKQFGLIDDTATSTEVRERLSIVYGTTRFRDYNAPKASLSSMLGLSLDVNVKEALSSALNTTSTVR